LLGLAARAGAVVPGTQLVRESVRAGRVHYVLVADDLTATGMDKLVPMLEAREVSYAMGYSRSVLGDAVGRGPLAAVGITDAGFARRLETLRAADSDGG
jgi:ribosomal protein L7Ae-like RNA K-turn-binding protein